MRMVWVFAICAIVTAGCGPESPKSGGGASPSDLTGRQVSDVESASIENVTLQQLTDVFMLGSDSTDVQRDKLRTHIVGKIVQWEIPVYEVSRDGGVYKITGAGDNLLPTAVFVTPRDGSERALIEALKTGSTVTIKGRVQDIMLRSLVVINPARLATTAMSVPNRTGSSTAGGIDTSPPSRWDIVGGGAGVGEGYVDRSTIRRAGDLGQLWRLDNYAQKQGPNNDVLSMTYLAEYNCESRQERILSSATYSGKMGTGTPVEVDHEPGDWRPIAPRTLGDKVLKMVCLAPSSPAVVSSDNATKPDSWPQPKAEVATEPSGDAKSEDKEIPPAEPKAAPGATGQ